MGEITRRVIPPQSCEGGLTSVKTMLSLGMEAGGGEPTGWWQLTRPKGGSFKWSMYTKVVGERSTVSERTSQVQSPRGYAVDAVWYPYSSEWQDQEERRAANCGAAVGVAVHDLANARSELLAFHTLLHVVRVSSVVQEDILALCQGCTALMEAISSSHDTLLSRARAAERRDARVSRQRNHH